VHARRVRRGRKGGDRVGLTAPAARQARLPEIGELEKQIKASHEELTSQRFAGEEAAAAAAALVTARAEAASALDAARAEAAEALQAAQAEGAQALEAARAAAAADAAQAAERAQVSRAAGPFASRQPACTCVCRAASSARLPDDGCAEPLASATAPTLLGAQECMHHACTAGRETCRAPACLPCTAHTGASQHAIHHMMQV